MQVLSLIEELRTRKPRDKKREREEQTDQRADGLCRVRESLCGAWVSVRAACAHMCVPAGWAMAAGVLVGM